MVTVLYFASLKEAVGLARETLALPKDATTVLALRRHLAVRPGPWDILHRQQDLQVAVNQTLATEATPIQDGDEIAFFPPVTGG